MGLRERIRFGLTDVPSVPRELAAPLFSNQSTLGQRLAYQAKQLAVAAREDVIAHRGSIEDIHSTAAALNSFYSIALKLHEIDSTLLIASGNQLDQNIKHRYAAGSASKDWLEAFAHQESALRDWAKGLDSAAKRRWFEQSLAIRGQIGKSLLEAYCHIERLRHDVGFLQGATVASKLLPQFAVDDAEIELLTTENAADKARILAESAANYDLPELESLDEPATLGTGRADSAPELSR